MSYEINLANVCSKYCVPFSQHQLKLWAKAPPPNFKAGIP